MLFSDLFDDVDGFIRGLDKLAFAGHNIVVFHTLDHQELEFPMDGTWQFRGLEGEPELVTQPKRIRASYMAELRSFLETIRRACDRSQIDYVLVDTSRPVDVTLTEFLWARKQNAGR